MTNRYGPHEEDVLEVLADADRLPPERLPELLAFASADDETGAAGSGRSRLQVLRSDPEVGPFLDQAEDDAKRWASELRYDHMLPMGGYEMGSGVDPRARSIAARVLFEAMAAVIARDHLTPDEFDALFGPWDVVAGSEAADEALEAGTDAVET